jgi:hypothetical protein
MRRSISLFVTAIVVTMMPLSAQNAAPALNFDSAPTPLVLPDDIYLGEVGGVATNSRGDIFVYTRTGHPTLSMGTARPFAHGGSRLFQFDRNGKFTREIGQGIYGFLFAAQVRVDPQDNLWVVDEMSSMVMTRRAASRFCSGARRKRFRIRRARADRAAAGAAKAAAEAVPLPARARSRTSSTVRRTSPGTRRAISSSPTAMATRASPNSRRTACS